jgi:hypothetical protein
MIHSEEAHSNENGTYCESCYDPDCGEDEDEDEDRPTPPLHNHSYTPVLKFHALPDEAIGALTLGWELEVDHKDIRVRRSDIVAAALPDFIYCKEDGSLKHGFEMVSHPGTWNYWDAADLSFCGKLVTMGYRSYDTSTCGMHVHVPFSFLNETERYKLLLFFRENQEFVVRLSRRKGQKSEPLDSDLVQLTNYAALDDSKKSELLRKAKGKDGSRYQAINLTNGKTVEFRIFRGTLNPVSVKRNLALVTMLCHYAKHCTASVKDMTTKAFLHYCRWHGAKIIGKDAHKALYVWVKIAVKKQLDHDEGH